MISFTMFYEDVNWKEQLRLIRLYRNSKKLKST